VDKPVDGQKAARPRVCPPPAAFPHTHWRNRKFKKKPKSKSLRATSPTSCWTAFFGGSVPLLKIQKKDMPEAA